MNDYTHPEDLSSAELARALVDIEVEVDGADIGTMTVEFWPETAPVTVRNFLRYAAEGFYDGLGFHRVISGFMIQGGCPRGDGTGSGPHGNIPGEFSADRAHTHARGVISMARAADPNSASCQFFICHGPADFLDGQYAAFGRLVEGDAVLDAVAATPVRPGPGGERSVPEQSCRIRRMVVRERKES